jgi:glycosyltransferase involved in cell wall biosynthesis
MILSKFDIFFYVTDGSYFFSTAKKNFSFCMVPQASLYKMTLMNKFKMLNYKFIANSNFTKYWLNKWNIHAKVIYPFINKDLIDLEVNKINKDKIILTVGRFFSHLHSKRQSEIIKLFTKLKQKYPMFKDFKLIITGGLKKQDEAYFNQLKLLTVNNPDIYLHANPSYEYLINLYKKSLIYLHFTGYGLEEKKHPDQVEHLGISPLEAMTCGCITFCYNAGGPKELIKNGRNGFLFNSEKELIKQVQMVLTNIALQKNIQIDAKKYITQNFSYAVFTERVRKEILSQ